MDDTLINKKSALAPKQIIKKLKAIEIEFENGNFENFDFFLERRSGEAINYALEWTSYYGKLELVKKAVEKNANINYSKSTALQMASRNGHYNVVVYLMECGMLNDLPDSNVLMEAVENKHYDIVKYLLSDKNIFCHKFCDVHTEYELPLRTAIEQNDVEMVRLLLEHGADVNAHDGLPILCALRIDNKDIFKLLIDSKIKPEILEIIKRHNIDKY
ncbi:ankyrin repeat protein [Tupanvirus soda lake]|uniref:Ankyrin repeat protein n=2 Tax=Tupanvirus TaxID=2094720 RepID=A0A6N1NVW6_9VIRU|nr:ankyrin repeat protein [Tupanvirus soda lake]QKU35443.1 ankyrin repeat protein [Tupanvirus soda lake]